MTTAFSVTQRERDDLKKNYPERYAQMLELVIAGKVVVIEDNDSQKVVGV